MTIPPAACGGGAEHSAMTAVIADCSGGVGRPLQLATPRHSSESWNPYGAKEKAKSSLARKQRRKGKTVWIPAFAGMTGGGMTEGCWILWMLSTPPEFAVPICRWGRKTPTPPRKRRGVWGVYLVYPLFIPFLAAKMRGRRQSAKECSR